MKKIYIIRDLFFDQQASLGTCIVVSEDCKRLFKSPSLERGWVNNQNMISCIPKGEYPVVLEYSDKFKKMLWEIKNVPGRSECKFHAANYWYELNGCVSLGRYEALIDGDPVMDVKYSGDTMDKFHKAMGDDTTATLIVTDLFDLI